MKIYTSCQTCGGELEVIDGRQVHTDCKPATPPIADQYFANFCQLVDRLMRPDHQPTEHDRVNLAALQDKIDQLDQEPPKLPAAALYYATRYGWPVFPLKPGGKQPATRNGFKDATTDVDQIKAWWTATPDANIGVPTGIRFDVIDVDLPDGPASWHQLRQKPNAPDVHGQVSTSSGGRHFLVEPRGKGNRARVKPGIDYRGVGGYVVAPPSWIDHPHRWTWITKPSPRLLKAN